MEQIRITELEETNTHYTQRIGELLSQLITSPISFSNSDLEAIVASPNSHIFFLYYGDEVAAMLTIGSYMTPTGAKYWIEDVVVDNAFRGKSLGKRLVEHAIAYVGKQKGATLMLTSNPTRIAANGLYQSLGFEQKETNVYRMPLDED